MRIVIIPNETKDIGYATTRLVEAELLRNGASVFVDSTLPYVSDKATRYADFPQDADAIVVIGGDGSILRASYDAIRYGIPLLGINLGKLGYMSELAPAEIADLKKLFNGDYTVEEKMLLSVTIEDADSATEHLAVNEVVLSHSNPVELTYLCLTDGKGASVKYRADGLILATPIGSTAYSLSAGGPIIMQDHPSILVTPICPHSFFSRSLIFSDEEMLSVSCGSQTALNVAVDGRPICTLNPGARCRVHRSEKNMKMIAFRKEQQMSALFSKLRMLDEI